MTTDHNISGGQPLMIWGGGGGNFLNEFYFMNIFFFKEAPENFFLEIHSPRKFFFGEWPSKFFFPGEGPLKNNFLDFLRRPPDH